MLTDLGLPDMSGEDIITSIRAVTQGRTPVAIMSGAAPDDLARAVCLGADRAFTKPFAWDDLVGYLTRRTVDGGARRDPPRTMENIMKVLIVEDDQAMRALLRQALERDGHRVIERADGADVPTLAETEAFDVAVLDKEVPGQNGLELLSSLRARRPAVSVILVTAFGGPAVAAEAARRGAYRYLEKPFRMAEFLATLATVPRPGPGQR